MCEDRAFRVDCRKRFDSNNAVAERLRSEMSRAVFDTPMTFPLGSLIADAVTETSINRPSFVRRIVSM